MGLRCPSECTQGTICGLVLQKEAEEKQQALLQNYTDLRQVFLNCKSRIQLVMQQGKPLSVPYPDGKYLLQLPADPREASLGLRQAAFPPCGSNLVAPQCDLEKLKEVVAKIPYRSKNVSAMLAQGFGKENVSPSFQMATQAAMVAANVLMASGIGARFGQPEPTTVSIIPPKPKPLQKLLSRASSGSMESAASSTLLALQDAPQVSSEVSLVSATGTAAVNDTHEVAHEAAPDKAGEAQPPAATDAQMESEKPKMSEATLPKPPSAECIANGQQNEVEQVSLKESLARMAQARAAVGKPAVMKRPASHSANVSKSKGSQVTKVSKTSKQKTSVKKRPASSKVKGNNTPQCLSKTQLLRKVSAADKKRFRDGCSRCRYSALCTLSCRQKRGY